MVMVKIGRKHVVVGTLVAVALLIAVRSSFEGPSTYTIDGVFGMQSNGFSDLDYLTGVEGVLAPDAEQPLTHSQYGSPGLLNRMFNGHNPIGLDLPVMDDVVGHGNKAPTDGSVRIAVCFFGLVKTMSPKQRELYQKHVVEPLRDVSQGHLEVFVHTYNFSKTNFSNPRNGEKNEVFDQTHSLKALAELFGQPLNVLADEPDDADKYFSPTNWFMKNGNPWKGNGMISVRYYLRQLYSLLRVTEMWTGIDLIRDPRIGTQATQLSTKRLPGAASMSSFQCVVYLRTDLLVGTPIPQRLIRFLCGGNFAGRRDVVVPSFEHGGLQDRFAIGSPEGMLLYGARGLRLRRYILMRRQPHAEQFLHHFLCENNVTVHLGPVVVQRLRANGHSPDPSPQKQLRNYVHRLVPFWSTWLTREANHSDAPQHLHCAPKTMWMP